MNDDCTEMRRILEEHAEKYDRTCFAVIEMPNPSEENHAEFDRLTKDYLRFLDHVKSCESCHLASLALEDQRDRLRRPEDIFCRANSTKAWETGLTNRLPREEVEEVRRAGTEIPCERAQRYARRYGPEDRYVQIHLSWCEGCRTALGDKGAAAENAPNAGSEAGGKASSEN
jgi:hypothetical protein